MAKTPKVRTVQWEIPIRGRKWSVLVAPKEVLRKILQEDEPRPLPEDFNIWGLCDETREQIFLNEEILACPTPFLRKILFHEITHARMNILDRSGTYNAEVLADTFADEEWDLMEYCVKYLPKDWR
jgi:hypothetical protein